MLQPMGLQRVRHNLVTEQEKEEAHSPGKQLRTRQSLLRSVGLQRSDLTERLSARTRACARAHTHTHTQDVWSCSSGQDVQTWRQTAGAGELASGEPMFSGKKGLSGVLPVEGGRGFPLPRRWQDLRTLAQASFPPASL